MRQVFQGSPKRQVSSRRWLPSDREGLEEELQGLGLLCTCQERGPGLAGRWPVSQAKASEPHLKMEHV